MSTVSQGSALGRLRNGGKGLFLCAQLLGAGLFCNVILHESDPLLYPCVGFGRTHYIRAGMGASIATNAGKCAFCTQFPAFHFLRQIQFFFRRALTQLMAMWQGAKSSPKAVSSHERMARPSNRKRMLGSTDSATARKRLFLRKQTVHTPQ